MFANGHSYSTITAVMPAATANLVLDGVLQGAGTSALTWKSRGTLLHDHWWQRLLPPVSPARTMLQMIVPRSQVASVMSRVVTVGKLDRQATGAAFSSPCDGVYFGSGYQAWPASDGVAATYQTANLREQLSIIYCVVGHAYSDRVARAAINAGAHGPIIYYSEGRGLRDRLGWLRVTKEAEKEVLMVIADQADVEDVFEAMANAGQLHLPGRGFMYRIAIDQGMYNLPSRVAHHHYDATMQQMINAIDHLAGHKHWRDQGVVEFSGGGRSIGLEFLNKSSGRLQDQFCMSCVVNRDQESGLMDLLLDTGAPGVNISRARFIAHHAPDGAAAGQVHGEYSLLRCVTTEHIVRALCSEVESSAESAGIADLCAMVHLVPRVATYVPGDRDYRVGTAA